jgi:4-diphosphocytidyl-2-C-methyl-D-erythritol kinase
MLHITGRRDDGYHELQTVFQFIDLCDELQFRRLPEDSGIHRVGGDGCVPADEDLVVRSARLLQQHCGVSRGVEIRLRKRIPMGAGLGGGSSDAATTLHALNRLWQLGLTHDQLAELGLSLGADVPVFIHGFAAFAEGIGERLQPIFPRTPWYLLVTPDVHVSTGEIFSDRELTRDCPAIKICDLSDEGGRGHIGPDWDNVLTPVVTARYPVIAEALARLGAVADADTSARMSGTGSTVFAGFDNRRQAEKAADSMQQNGLPASWQVTINRGHNTSPLFAFMKML